MSVNLTAPPRPTALAVQAETIPAELIALDRWVVWRYAWTGTGWTKTPYQANDPARNASTTNPATWSTFAAALEAYEQGKADGIGFVITAADPFVGGDVDHCIDPTTGHIDEETAATVAHVPTYWELSAGGQGLHFFARGTFAGRGRKNGPHEIYREGRFFTVTGHHLAGTLDDIHEVQPAIDALYKEWFPESPAKNDVHAGGGGTPSLASEPLPGRAPVRADDLTDDEILDLARHAKNGPKFSRLWTGDTADYLDDDSRADAGLAGILAFYSSDADQIERLMRQSGLARAKWDRHRSYMARTIDGAIAKTTERYHRSIPVALSPASVPTVPFHDETARIDAGRETADCLDQARALIQELQFTVAQRDQEIARLTAENAELLALQRRTAAAMRNAPMKALAPIAIPLAHVVSSVRRANPTDTGPVKIYLPDLAHAAGRSTATISRALVELEGDGLIERHEETERKWRNDDRTREMVPCDVTRISIDLKGTPEQFLERISTFVPTKAPHGGYGKRCPHHPHADVKEQLTCTECGFMFSEKIIKGGSFHDETASAPPADQTHPATTIDPPIQTAMLPSVVPLPVAVWTTPLKHDETPSVVLPTCPRCATPSERLGSVVLDDHRGRFACPACREVFWAELRATIPGRERFDQRIVQLPTVWSVDSTVIPHPQHPPPGPAGAMT